MEDNRRETNPEKRTASDRRTVTDRRTVSDKKASDSQTAAQKRTAPVRRTSSEGKAVTDRRTAGDRKTASDRRTTAEGTAPGRTGTDNRTARRPETGRPDGNRKRPNNRARKRKRRNAVIRVAVIMVLIVAAIGGAAYWTKYGPSKDKADVKEYYGIEGENQLAVIVNNDNVKAQGMLYDGKPYIEYTTVRDHLNERFYWDANENILLYTLPREMVSVGVGSNEYTVGTERKSEDYTILKTEGRTAYIALDFIKQYTDLEYKTYKDPDRVMIVSEWETKVAEVKKDTQIRVRGGIKSPVLTEVNKKDQVTFVESEDDWIKVRTEDGYVGYIKANCLRKEESKVVSRDFEEPVFTNITKDKTINLAWNMVTNETANTSVLETIANTKGLTTISPTWFTVADTQGNLVSIASPEYVNYAHQSGIEVWAMVSDFDHGFGGITTADEILETLSYTSRRDNLTNQLIAAALQNGVDGINVDFEHIYTEEAGFHFIQFIRELSVKCRQNNLVLSVDNYVPQGYNMQYHRKEQGIVADYVIIMGYDEHQSSSFESGSVASYDFVKEGITKTLDEVPAEKVINAVPFYTRLWSERPKTEEELAADDGTEAADYKTKIECQTLGMTDAQEVLAGAGVTASWDETTKQNYAEWDGSDGLKYKIWLEDAQSIEAKLQLMKEYKLAGTAAWRIGYETPDIWEMILQYVN